MKTKISKKEKLTFFGFALVVLALIAVGHFLDLGERMTLNGMREAIQNTGVWQFPAFTLLYCVSALTPAPTTLLSTASGALWGPYVGTAVTVASATLAACIPFLLSRVLGRKMVGKMLQRHPTADKCDRFAGRNGFLAVLTMRLIPIFPWDAVNYLSGLCGIHFHDYLLASLLGTIPRVSPTI